MAKNQISTDELILRFASKVASIIVEKIGKKLTSVCLFGSAVKKRLRRGSDVDFLVVLRDAPSSYHKRVKLVVPLLDEIREATEYKHLEELNLQIEPSFLLLSKEEIETHPPILIDISYEGVILYDKGGFLGNHLFFIKERLTKLGATKKITSMGYYWILKPDLQAGEAFEI